MVHVGFAISLVDQEEAERVFELLDQIGELDELNGHDGESAMPTQPAGRETERS